MAQKIIGAQRDFSYGEVDVTLKRADDHPARKGGLRQMSNFRILNSGAVQDRPGRRALYPTTNNPVRTERVSLVAGTYVDIQFARGLVKIISSAGVTLATFTTKGNGDPLPWITAADIASIVYAVGTDTAIYICYGHAMRPQVISFDGSNYSIADFAELVVSGGQKRTPFYRLSTRGVTILPSAATGAGITVTASANVFVPGHVGTRIRYVNRQILITGYTDAKHVTGTVIETLPSGEQLNFASATGFIVGDILEGSVSGAFGIVTVVHTNDVIVQPLATASGSIIPFGNELVVNQAGGSQQVTSVSTTGPQAVVYWDDEIMNDYRGYPASVFVDQFRVGFCNFPAIPGGIAWSTINSPTDLYVVGATVPSGAMFEIAPNKAQVYFVVPGPEGSEFVFCDQRIYYIPISTTNPLKPGSVGFNMLSRDGSANVQPRLAQETIVYANAGQNSMMAIIATGAYQRPFNTKGLADFHAHLFNNITAIACPSADGSFNERYAYVMNADGSIVVGKYDGPSLASNDPKVGWGPWSGAGAVSWVASYSADVIFTTAYFGSGVVEALDDSEYLDCALPVNALPAAFNPQPGYGPLWFIASQSVSLIDQQTRSMGTYQIDANGFIVPQGNGGENLAAASLIAGQPWTSTLEPFAPDAPPGPDGGQRMKLRQISYFGAYVIHSTGFAMGTLFSGRLTRTSPALGTLMNERRFPAWMQDDDPTLPPPERETVEINPVTGSSFDPRPVLFKDTPGPLQILELVIEVSI